MFENDCKEEDTDNYLEEGKRKKRTKILCHLNVIPLTKSYTMFPDDGRGALGKYTIKNLRGHIVHNKPHVFSRCLYLRVVDVLYDYYFYLGCRQEKTITTCSIFLSPRYFTSRYFSVREFF